MTPADVPAADELRRLAGWNQRPQDWHRLLELEPEGCFVACAGARMLGTVTTTTYGTDLAWIGMMLVHPEHRRKGVATSLMRRALAYLEQRGVACVKLDATPAGRPLYEQLGFVAESTLTRWGRSAGASPSFGRLEPNGLVEIQPCHWPTLEELDSAAMGARRLRLLSALARSIHRGLVYQSGGQVSGWGLLRSGINADYLGPVVCRDGFAASRLLPVLIGAGGTRDIFWDIFDQHQLATQLAKDLGFAPVRPLTRMRFGPAIPIRSPETLYAIADPAVG